MTSQLFRSMTPLCIYSFISAWYITEIKTYIFISAMEPDDGGHIRGTMWTRRLEGTTNSPGHSAVIDVRF